MLAHADVADLEAMRAVVSRANDRFGEIHGVIHAAACTREGSQRFIQEASESDCEQQFRPKVLGLIVLEELFRGAPLDFFGLFSSLASVLGGLKFAAYSAANLFLDATAQQQNHGNPVPWISISWDGWQLGLDERDGSDIGVDLANAAVTSAEGLEAFSRILSMTEAAHVLVSTSDLYGRLDKWVKLESLRDSGQSAQAGVPVEHARPELSNAYEAPRTELERAIAQTWSDLLGIDRVGIYDNFFELGGHSLVGTQVISWLRQEFRVELSLRRLLDAPTVADMGVAIVQLQAQQADRDTLAELLSELEELSDESVEASLDDREAVDG
jgi:NAD(P)-dependent dehydrogenase (short-subunit alcohol dehydrogenase family)